MGRIAIIAALGKNRELGAGNGLLWHIPEDLRRFKELTNGHPVVMGRKTWESLPEKYRPLANRTNIVITRRDDYEASGAVVVSSLAAALRAAERSLGDEESFVMGGGELYREALPFADRLYLTLIEGEKEADTFFPEYEKEFPRVVSEEPREWEGLRYRWVTRER